MYKTQLIANWWWPIFQGADGNTAYIALQGPLPRTVDDFWRLIASHRCQVDNVYTFLYYCYLSSYWIVFIGPHKYLKKYVLTISNARRFVLYVMDWAFTQCYRRCPRLKCTGQKIDRIKGRSVTCSTDWENEVGNIVGIVNWAYRKGNFQNI